MPGQRILQIFHFRICAEAPQETAPPYSARPNAERFGMEVNMSDKQHSPQKPGHKKLSAGSPPVDDGLLEDEFLWDEVEEPRRETRASKARRPGRGKSSSGARRRRPARPSAVSGRKRRRGKETYVHLVLLSVIVLMFLSAAIRLIIWNIGEDSGYDPNADSSAFSTEPQDYIQPMDASLLEGHEDDGVDTIVCLGNSPFSDERGSGGLADLIAQKCNATVYNCAFPNSYLSMKYQEYSDSYPLDAFSLYLVTASFCGGDFTLMQHAADLISEDADNTREALDTLTGLDFSTVDMIVIMYDLNDYMDDRPVMDENNDINLLTWNGALNASIQLIQQTYPYIRIVVLSPSYGQFTDESGELINADIVDFGNGALPDYVLHEIDVAMANGVSILDNYYGSVTELDAAECLTDGYHLNGNGREKIAQRFAELIFLVNKEGGS